MNTATGSIKAKREIAWRINGWHIQVEFHRAAYSEAVYSSLGAAWQAGRLLLVQKRKVARSHWRLWLERHFNGTACTAQRHMTLAKAVPNATQLRGFSLRQAYLRLGIAVAGLAQVAASWYSFLPMHTVLANRFERWLRQKGDTTTLPDQEKQTLRRDLRPLYEWLVSLFDDAGSTARTGRRSG